MNLYIERYVGEMKKGLSIRNFDGQFTQITTGVGLLNHMALALDAYMSCEINDINYPKGRTIFAEDISLAAIECLLGGGPSEMISMFSAPGEIDTSYNNKRNYQKGGDLIGINKEGQPQIIIDVTATNREKYVNRKADQIGVNTMFATPVIILPLREIIPGDRPFISFLDNHARALALEEGGFHCFFSPENWPENTLENFQNVLGKYIAMARQKLQNPPKKFSKYEQVIQTSLEKLLFFEDAIGL